MNYGDLKSRVRFLVDDDAGSYTTDAYLGNCANQCYEYLQARAELTDYAFDETEVEITGIQPGVGNLNDYMAAGKPLEFILVPSRLESKQAGTLATNYQDANKVDRLPDMTPGQFIPFWKWELGNLSFNPSSLAVDVRVSGNFLLSPLKQEEDAIGVARNFGHIMAYAMAFHIGIQRGNPGWEKSYQGLCDESFDNWAIKMVKEDQVQVRRIGRMSRRVTPRQSVVTR